mmetsp:Transcript_10388/g.32392  ORF Transcript_10388/g.32392 Transcript_10388/m.32392 type:complete len:421 (-) Transcript_10388:1096-2358(-)
MPTAASTPPPTASAPSTPARRSCEAGHSRSASPVAASRARTAPSRPALTTTAPPHSVRTQRTPPGCTSGCIHSARGAHRGPQPHEGGMRRSMAAIAPPRPPLITTEPALPATHTARAPAPSACRRAPATAEARGGSSASQITRSSCCEAPTPTAARTEPRPLTTLGAPSRLAPCSHATPHARREKHRRASRAPRSPAPPQSSRQSDTAPPAEAVAKREPCALKATSTTATLAPDSPYAESDTALSSPAPSLSSPRKGHSNAWPAAVPARKSDMLGCAVRQVAATSSGRAPASAVRCAEGWSGVTDGGSSSSAHGLSAALFIGESGDGDGTAGLCGSACVLPKPPPPLASNCEVAAPIVVSHRGANGGKASNEIASSPTPLHIDNRTSDGMRASVTPLRAIATAMRAGSRGSTQTSTSGSP